MNGRSASQQACNKNPQGMLPGREGPRDHLTQPSHSGDRETGPGSGRECPSHPAGSGEMCACTPGVLSLVGLFLL